MTHLEAIIIVIIVAELAIPMLILTYLRLFSHKHTNST